MKSPIARLLKVQLCVSIWLCIVLNCGIVIAEFKNSAPPNIVLILADDLGYGDIRCYNADSKVPTPNIDALAKQGIRFTDAHSPATVCTPSRYSILTGRMCFRTGYRGVFSGVGGPALIEAGRLTLPGMLQKSGYKTACIGKWHLGMTFQTMAGQPAFAAKVAVKSPQDWRMGGPALERVRLVDFSKPIPDGPIHRGFDTFFGTACCPTTDWLYAYIQQDRVPVPPSKQLDASPLPKHAYSHDNRRGMIAPDYDLEEVDLVFLKKSQEFLREHKKTSPSKPFFLFHSMQAVHLPSFPAKQFQGKSNAGPHGDFILEMDWIVGELMMTLESLDLTGNTLVIFASDNGPEVTTVINMRADHQHDGARPWRGLKRDQWEGGHRTPFIIRWPHHAKAGTKSDQMLSLTDLMATIAAIVDFQLPDDAAEDSFNFLPVLAGKGVAKPIRKYLLQQTISLALSIREGDWKYLDHKGSGGNRYDRGPLKQFQLPETAPQAPGQLYNLKTDPGETTNLYFQYPEKVKTLKSKLEKLKAAGRSNSAD